MRIISTIEARMGSTRLPGKVLLPVIKSTMLELLIERLKKVELIDQIIVATTISEKDKPIVDLCEKNSLKYYRGSEDDVMDRVINAANSLSADLIVEITGDCPLIDPSIVDQLIRIYLANKVDYVSNAIIRSYPDGMDVQVFSLDTLKRSSKMTSKKLDREHVTLHIRNNPEIFSHINVVAPKELHFPKLGLTLDEEEDYFLIKKIFEELYKVNKYFNCFDIIRFLDDNLHLYSINNHVKRKGNN